MKRSIPQFDMGLIALSFFLAGLTPLIQPVWERLDPRVEQIRLVTAQHANERLADHAHARRWAYDPWGNAWARKGPRTFSCGPNGIDEGGLGGDDVVVRYGCVGLPVRAPLTPRWQLPPLFTLAPWWAAALLVAVAGSLTLSRVVMPGASVWSERLRSLGCGLPSALAGGAVGYLVAESRNLIGGAYEPALDPVVSYPLTLGLMSLGFVALIRRRQHRRVGPNEQPNDLARLLRC